MTNEEVFKEYGTEKWVIEENLCYLLQEYAEKLGASNPYNPVSFIKKWMKEDTFINKTYAEKSLLSHCKENVVSDAEYKEVQSDYDLG